MPPRFNLRPVAARSAAPNEAIAEFTGAAGEGGLIAIRDEPDGTLSVRLYCLAPQVRIALSPVTFVACKIAEPGK